MVVVEFDREAAELLEGDVVIVVLPRLTRPRLIASRSGSGGWSRTFRCLCCTQR